MGPVKQLLLPVVLVLMWGVAGCASRRSPEYGVVFVNTRREAIKDVALRFDGSDYAVSVATLPPLANVGELTIPHPLPPTAVLQWRPLNGVLEQRRVAIAKYLPERFDGDVYIRFDQDGSISLVLLDESGQRLGWDPGDTLPVAELVPDGTVPRVE